MFGVDFYRDVLRFISLTHADRVETMYLMSERIGKMRMELIFLPSHRRVEGAAELRALSTRLDKWMKIHTFIPW